MRLDILLIELIGHLLILHWLLIHLWSILEILNYPCLTRLIVIDLLCHLVVTLNHLLLLLLLLHIIVPHILLHGDVATLRVPLLVHIGTFTLLNRSLIHLLHIL